MTVRTRFAPSPTGSLHVGGARTALYCRLYAHAAGGRFVLRIEDTDQVRSTEAATQGIVRDLGWLGLTWDEGPLAGGEFGPYLQSERLETYQRHVDALLAEGKAYEAWESREELAALREAAGTGFVYRRRTLPDVQIEAYRAAGRASVVRLDVGRGGEGRVFVVHDAILGQVDVQASEIEDLVIRKADGFPTYHFAVVVDDHLMGITQILRGQEHLKNTHKHLAIAEALGWTLPAVGHLPLINNPQGQKMSKREKARTARDAGRKHPGGPTDVAARAGLAPEVVAAFLANENDGIATAEAIARGLGVDLPMIEVMDFRRAGYLAEALLNYLALLGWSPGGDREILSLEEMQGAFALDRVGNTAARFDAAKLTWMNGTYLRSLPRPRLLAAAAAWREVAAPCPTAALSEDRFDALLTLYEGRFTTFVDLDRQARALLVRPAAWDRASVDKHLTKGGGWDVLGLLGDRLREITTWTAAALEADLTAFGAEAGLGLGRIAQPLRIALTGTAVTPPIFETLAFVGREESKARVDALRAARGLGRGT